MDLNVVVLNKNIFYLWYIWWVMNLRLKYKLKNVVVCNYLIMKKYGEGVLNIYKLYLYYYEVFLV